MTGLVPGAKWPATAELRAHCAHERLAFAEWIMGLDVSEVQRRVLVVLLEMVLDAEFVDGRCAGVTYPAEVARRCGGLEDVDGVLSGLAAAGYLSIHPASVVFGEDRPGIVFRLCRPGVVLSVESGHDLWAVAGSTRG